MAEILYKTMLFTDESKVIGLSESNTDDLADFIDNHKTTAQKVDAINLVTTSFSIELSYENVTAQVLVWSDVRYTVSSDLIYTLFLLKTV